MSMKRHMVLCLFRFKKKRDIEIIIILNNIFSELLEPHDGWEQKFWFTERETEVRIMVKEMNQNL